MDVQQLALPGLILLKPAVFTDPRGWFFESFQQQRYREYGIDCDFVQDNVSRSTQGILRGLHFQHPHGQAKLVTVITGAVFDVAVDIRRGSPTFGQWVGVELNDANHRQLFIPPGFAHGFVVLSEVADFHYKCSDYYSHADEKSIVWNDTEIGIEWPISDVELSEKDQQGLALSAIPIDALPVFTP